MKLLLVDTHALYREGLALLITRSFPELELLQAGNIAEALGQLERHGDVDLMLLDLELPDAEGARGVLQVRARAPRVSVVLLSGDSPPEALLEAIQAGAAGFIPKASPAGFMQKALRRVLDSGLHLPPTPRAPLPAAVDVEPEAVPAAAGSLNELTQRKSVDYWKAQFKCPQPGWEQNATKVAKACLAQMPNWATLAQKMKDAQA